MSDHVTAKSHPELTEGQREEVNEGVDKWCSYNSISDRLTRRPGDNVVHAEYTNAVERIVAEVTASPSDSPNPGKYFAIGAAMRQSREEGPSSGLNPTPIQPKGNT